jgi:hypothetical protein
VTPQFSRRTVVLVLGFFVPALLYALAPSTAYACTGVVEATPSGSAGAIPPEGPSAGTALTVSGAGFVAGPVVLRWGASDGPKLGRTVTDSDGTFSLEVVVPDVTGPRPRIIALSTEPSSSGLPSTGWVDLGTPEPASAAPAGPAATAAVEEPVDEQSPVDAVPAGIGVLLLGLILAVGIAARRRGAATGAAVTAGAGHLDDSADLDRELAELLEPEAVPGGTEDAGRG